MLRRAAAACTESLGSDSGDSWADELELPAASPPLGEDEEEEVGGSEVGLHRSPEDGRKDERAVLLTPAMPRLVARTRPERRGGRLILIEVQIGRPWALHVSRSNGRLRLRLACPSDGVDEASRERTDAASSGENGTDGGSRSGGAWLGQVAASVERLQIGAVVGI